MSLLGVFHLYPFVKSVHKLLYFPRSSFLDIGNALNKFLCVITYKSRILKYCEISNIREVLLLCKNVYFNGKHNELRIKISYLVYTTFIWFYFKKCVFFEKQLKKLFVLFFWLYELSCKFIIIQKWSKFLFDLTKNEFIS